MFILTGTIAAAIISAIEIFAFCRNRSAGKCIHTVIRNIFVINLISIGLLKYVFKYQHFLITDAYGTASFVKFFFLALIVGAVLLFISAFINRYFTFESETPKKKAGARFIKVFSVILFTLGALFYFGTVWGKGSYGDVSADQLLINLISPAGGAEDNVYIEGIEGPVFNIMLATSVFCLFVFSNFKIKYSLKQKTAIIFNDLVHRIISLVLALAVFIGGAVYGYQEFNLKQLYYAYFTDSDFIEINYADPRETKITFPEQKRNIIHIYLESMENSYLSKDLGGYMEMNLMPELTELSYEGVTFSDTSNRFGGPLTATGTQWSVASMVNMTTGLPMKVPAEPNAYGTADSFLPGAYTFGEILRDAGYEQTVMIGSDANFGGLTYFFTNHGEYKIMDYRYAIKNGLIPEDYKVWWGFEDDKLYEFAKEEITRLYETGKPFNFTMETADTHRPGGYLSENAPTPYDDHYANAIAYSSEQTVEFVKWIQQQPFYENTTIVLIGDHLSMDTDFFEDFDSNYKRTQFNLILNAAPEVADTKSDRFVNRQYANFDMFPTILASMGVEIKGDRLGIGTNLFSDKDTIFEEYGTDKVNMELEKKSDFYNEKILEDYSASEEQSN
uniref:LTA synthase family protein n=1 Tax=Eubacterium sp. TaxID=142586 RepID=UPI004027BC0B